jgi:hypothetical protein
VGVLEPIIRVLARVLGYISKRLYIALPVYIGTATGASVGNPN